MARIHDLKILPIYFTEVVAKRKTFEIRKNDRAFCVGDMVRLKEWEKGDYTGMEVTTRITYLTDFQQKPGYLVFSFELQNYQPLLETIKELRRQTGAGLPECKSALIDANGNLELAIENMRNKGNA
ncbi:DUF3850 domain-containing protein [Listeria monocytogenes]|nr:DUF3850 domain-containing protein [Listeria monocytogenes]